jgi:hypothetical protein
MSNPRWSEAESGESPPRNQSLGKATHESAPTLRIQSKGVGFSFFICHGAADHIKAKRKIVRHAPTGSSGSSAKIAMSAKMTMRFSLHGFR